MNPKKNTLINVFISYGQKGPKIGIDDIKDILHHLSNQRQNGYKLDLFYDEYLKLGNDFDEQIEQKLRNADVVIILVTRAFFFSDYVHEKEKPIILELRSDSYKIIPVLIEPTNYSDNWLFKLKLPTIPNRLNKTVYKANLSRPDLWNEIERGLDEVFHDVVIYKKSFLRKVGINKNEENLKKGCLNQLRFMAMFAASILIIFFLIRKNENRDELASIQDMSEWKRDTSTFEEVVPIRFHPERDKEKQVDSYDEVERGRDDISYRKRRSNNNLHDRTYPMRVHNNKYRREPYGIYESCQGLNKDGFKPCKKNRRWYIVNETLNIHHEITFETRTHKDIYAIRPFYANIAEVFFYDDEKMYLSFCLDLDDEKVTCNLIEYE